MFPVPPSDSEYATKTCGGQVHISGFSDPSHQRKLDRLKQFEDQR